MSRFFFVAWTAETHSTIKVLFILYFVSDPESESKSESIRSQESESESEQPHHNPAPLTITISEAICRIRAWDVVTGETVPKCSGTA